MIHWRQQRLVTRCRTQHSSQQRQNNIHFVKIFHFSFRKQQRNDAPCLRSEPAGVHRGQAIRRGVRRLLTRHGKY